MQHLIRAADEADRAWHALLVERYGKDAGDARYDPKRNAATPELAAARERKLAADRNYYANMDSYARQHDL
jgi:hypothetical protein